MIKANGDTIADNRRAFYEYFIEDTFEAGLILMGSEVKSLRLGKASIAESHAANKDQEIFLFNANISEYLGANRFNHEPKRPRKLLLHKRERQKLSIAVQRKGMTIVPLALYFNARGLIKLKIGLAKGKRQTDKRHVEKDRDWKREQQRILKSA